MAPIIGIAFGKNIENDPDNNYIRAIKEFGGIPVTLYPGISRDAYANIDGLLLTGGGDLHPNSFGAAWHPSLIYVNEARDNFEMPLCRQVLEENLPVLGICYGIQIMSVAMGGNMYQDIPSEYPKKSLRHKIKRGDSAHEIQIEPNNRLREIIGKSSEQVNSAHHQAIKDVGDGFVVTARSPDGVIEAIENPSKDFVLGVQYHPERMIQTAECREHRGKLFTAFIDAASG